MERLGDIYFERDFPVLRAAARWEERGRPQRSLMPETIAEELGRPVEQVIESLGRLCNAGLVDCAEANTFGGDYYFVNRLTPAGLQESGLWPKASDLSEALTRVLQREIQVTANSDPERSRRLKAILDYARDFGSDFLAKLAAELLKNLPH